MRAETIALMAVLSLAAACGSSDGGASSATAQAAKATATIAPSASVAPAATGPASSATPAERTHAVLEVFGGAGATAFPERATSKGIAFDRSLRARSLVDPDIARVRVAAKGEGVPMPAVNHVLDGAQSTFAYCYSLGYKSNPNLLGDVTLNLSLGPERVSVTSKESSLPEDVTVRCLVERVPKLGFPRPTSGTAEVTVKLSFLPGY